MSASASSSTAMPVGSLGLADAPASGSGGGEGDPDAAGATALKAGELEMLPDHSACALQVDVWSKTQVLINLVTAEQKTLEGTGWVLDVDGDGFAVIVKGSGQAEEATVLWPSELFYEVLHRDHIGAQVVVRRAANGSDQVVRLEHEDMRREDFVAQWAVGALLAKVSMEVAAVLVKGFQSRCGPPSEPYSGGGGGYTPACVHIAISERGSGGGSCKWCISRPQKSSGCKFRCW